MRANELLPDHPLLLISLARSLIARGEEGDIEAGELALRDAHQSLLATRMRIEDMLPIAPKLDKRWATVDEFALAFVEAAQS